MSLSHLHMCQSRMSRSKACRERCTTAAVASSIAGKSPYRPRSGGLGGPHKTTDFERRVDWRFRIDSHGVNRERVCPQDRSCGRVSTYLRRRNRQKLDMLHGTSPSPVVLTTNTARELSSTCGIGTASRARAAVSNPRRLAMPAIYSATSWKQ